MYRNIDRKQTRIHNLELEHSHSNAAGRTECILAQFRYSLKFNIAHISKYYCTTLCPLESIHVSWHWKYEIKETQDQRWSINDRQFVVWMGVYLPKSFNTSEKVHKSLLHRSVREQRFWLCGSFEKTLQKKYENGHGGQSNIKFFLDRTYEK